MLPIALLFSVAFSFAPVVNELEVVAHQNGIPASYFIAWPFAKAAYDKTFPLSTPIIKDPLECSCFKTPLGRLTEKAVSTTGATKQTQLLNDERRWLAPLETLPCRDHEKVAESVSLKARNPQNRGSFTKTGLFPYPLPMITGKRSLSQKRLGIPVSYLLKAPSPNGGF